MRLQQVKCLALETYVTVRVLVWFGYFIPKILLATAFYEGCRKHGALLASLLILFFEHGDSNDTVTWYLGFFIFALTEYECSQKWLLLYQHTRGRRV